MKLPLERHHCYVLGATGTRIATCWTQATAAEFVRAVNGRQRLVAALKEAEQELCHRCYWWNYDGKGCGARSGKCEDDTVPGIRALLAEIEGAGK